MNVLRLVLYICSVACSVHACVHWSLLTCFSTCSESLRLLKLDVKKTQHKSALPMVVNITASTSRKPDEYLVCKRLWPLYEFPPQTMHYYCATITCILSLIDPQKIGKLMTPERMSQENKSEMNCFIFQANGLAQKKYVALASATSTSSTTVELLKAQTFFMSSRSFSETYCNLQ